MKDDQARCAGTGRHVFVWGASSTLPTEEDDTTAPRAANHSDIRAGVTHCDETAKNKCVHVNIRVCALWGLILMRK